MSGSDVPTGLLFVDPTVVETTFRFALWAAPGEGKTVAAASAPAPILAVSADRPSAYAYARRHHGGKEIREVRYVGAETLVEVYRYLQGEGSDIATVVIDPISNVYDQLVEVAPKRADGEVDYQAVNKKVMGFITSLRKFDVHLVLVAHEKLNEGKRGDGKLYPRIGGATLISKAMAEMDVVAHVEHVANDSGRVYYGQIQPTDALVGKDGTNALGEKRVIDLTRWIELMRAYNAVSTTDTSDLPWAPSSAQPGGDPTAGVEAGASGADQPEVEPTGAPSAGNGDRNEAGYATRTDAAPPEPTPLPEGEAPIDATLAASRAAYDGKLDTVAMGLLLIEEDWALLELLAAGHTAASAAEVLGATPEGVRAHVNTIKRNLGQTSIAPIVKLAREMATDADGTAAA